MCWIMMRRFNFIYGFLICFGISIFWLLSIFQCCLFSLIVKFLSLCVCVCGSCVCAHAHVCMCVCMCVCAHVRARAAKNTLSKLSSILEALRLLNMPVC